MRKITLIFLLLLTYFNATSQCSNDCVTRGALAGVIYEVVYDGNNPDNYQPMANYPTAYIDVDASLTLQKKISLVSYLDYGDGITVLGHLSSGGYLLTNGIVGRGEALVALMEAWDIQPDYTGSVSYNDVDSSHQYYGYINEAEDLDLLDGLFGSNFNSYYGITSTELVTIISRIQNTNYHPVSNSVLQDEDKMIDVGVLFKETLENNKIIFRPTIEIIDDLSHYNANTIINKTVARNTLLIENFFSLFYRNCIFFIWNNRFFTALK